ncbi:MAG: lipoate--protein ligase family protein [Pirellulaceae bacterium]
MQGRLIPLSTDTGSWNMSVDQALLESVDATQIPMLRFYQWSAPTLSLGYFQKLADRNQHHASRGVECVRRSTGGGAILHHHELTYSIAVPTTSSHTGARMELYQGMHDVLRRGLLNWSCRTAAYRDDPQRQGRDDSLLCFQRRSDEDLIASGYKVLGSAQRSARRAILQHGSLLISASPFAPELPGITDLGASRFAVEELIEIVLADVKQQMGIAFSPEAVSPIEEKRAREIQTQRFASDGWLQRR